MAVQTTVDTDPPIGKAPVSVAKSTNLWVAGRLRDYADLLISQGEGGFRSQAYHRAANVVALLKQPVSEILLREGRAGLIALPAIGPSIAGSIAEMLATGHWSQLERLRGELAPEILFRTVPGIGVKLAHRLAEDARLESLEDLEQAVHFDDPSVKGLGPRRKRMIAAILSERLGRAGFGQPTKAEAPPVDLLLEVDRMYRERATAGRLRKIAPRRFNPAREAWLPIMHASHEGWHFTVLYSNSRLAHELNKTSDWVVIHYQRDGAPEGRVTVVTQMHGPTAGQRVVRGREDEPEGKDERK
jgi:hypothetical protein